MLKSVDFELHVQEPYFSQLKGIILFFSFIYMFFNLLLCSFAYFQGFDNCRKLLSFVGGCKTVEGRCASSNNNRYDIIWLVFDWGGECGHCKMCILFLYGKWENRSLRILRIEVTGYHIHLVKWLNLTNFNTISKGKVLNSTSCLCRLLFTCCVLWWNLCLTHIWRGVLSE